MSKTQKPNSKPKFGSVAIAGLPNAGKSTLMNAMIGARLAIVSEKPQTTRSSIMGVVTGDEGQIVFFDTPGIHKSDTLINRRMMQSVRAALDGKDLLLYVADAREVHENGLSEAEAEALSAIRKARELNRVPAFLVLNKIDLIEDKRLLLPKLKAFAEAYDFDELIPVSARKKDNLDSLRKAIFARLPFGEPRYEEDFLTDMPERSILAEVIREKVLKFTGEEVPHSVAVVVEKWEDKPNVTHVMASIIVEKEGQKPILIGAKGSMIKQIGTEARKSIEDLLGRRFFLELFVKVKPKWRENESFLNELGWQNTSEVI